MKGFTRGDLNFSLCGLNCGLCPMRLDGYCPGCGGGAGNQPCAVARCALEHGSPEYCFLCADFPCARLELDSEYGHHAQKPARRSGTRGGARH